MKKINIIVLLLGIFGFISSSVADTSPGLTFEITTTGSGASAALGQRATLHYIGKLEDGSVFDSSRDRGEPFSFTLGAGQVIQGWEQGVLGMQIGETRILNIPPGLGYGEAGAGRTIPLGGSKRGRAFYRGHSKEGRVEGVEEPGRGRARREEVRLSC